MISFVPPVPWHLDNPTGEICRAGQLSARSFKTCSAGTTRLQPPKLSVRRVPADLSELRSTAESSVFDCTGNAARKPTLLSEESKAFDSLVSLSAHRHNSRLIKSDKKIYIWRLPLVTVAVKTRDRFCAT